MLPAIFLKRLNVMPSASITQLMCRAVLSLVMLLPAAAGAQEKLTIGGAGTALGTMRQLGDAYAAALRTTTISVLPSLGALGGVHALRSGAVDIAVVTRALSPAEVGSDTTAVEIGRVPFVFAVNVSNPVTDIRSAQLLDIYRLKQTTWPDGSRIRLVLRPPAVSDTIFLKDLSPAWKQAVEALGTRPGMVEVSTAQEAAGHVERSVHALTTSTLNLILTEKRAMKALRVDGIEPNAQTVMDGTYPYFKPVILVVRRMPSSSAAAFVAYARSKAGRAILMQSGHVVPPGVG